jgi:hypothetical protein
MRTLDLHTADDLAVRWKKRAAEAAASCNAGDEFDGYYAGLAEAYRAAAAELDAVAAVTMEMEAAHHGDPEPFHEQTPARSFLPVDRHGDFR